MIGLVIGALLAAGGVLLIGLSWHGNLQAAGRVIAA